MFADLVGSTTLSVQLDAEDLREVVRDYRTICAAEIESRGGMIQSFAGDGLLAYFGYPIAREDAARSAVEAGLAIAETLRVLDHPITTARGLPLAARMAVHTGRVLIGEIGSGEAREMHAVTGINPNLAARLEALAPHNGVVISDATRQLVKGAFRVESLGPQTLKGLPEPIEAFNVLGRNSRSSVLNNSAVRLFGRDTELAALDAAWRAVRGGATRRIGIVADPGMGKSALATHFVSFAGIAGIHIVGFAGEVARRNSPFAALRQAIRKHLPTPDHGSDVAALATRFFADRPDAARHAETFRSILDGAVPDGAEGREAIYAALETWLNAARAPRLIVVEDGHWLDPSTFEMLDRVSRTSAPSRLYLMLSRPQADTRWSEAEDLTLRLGRLSTEGCRALASAVAGHPVETSLVARIEAATDGLPLYVEEFTKTLLESGAAAERRGTVRLVDSAMTLQTPGTLLDLITSRLDGLGSARELAQAAAVLGRRLQRSALAVVRETDIAALEPDIARLEQAAILLPLDADGLTFRHALYQKAAYESLTRPARRVLHERFVAWLQAAPERWAAAPPEERGYHLEGCGRAYSAALEYVEAGHAANRASASLEAAIFFGRAREQFALSGEAADGETRLLTQVLLAGALLSARGPGAKETRAAYDEALALAETVPESEWHLAAYWGWWRVSDTFATMAARAKFLLKASERMKGEEFRLQAMHCAWANAFAMGDIDASIRIARDGLTLYDKAGFAEQSTLYGGHDCKVCALGETALSTWLQGAGDGAAALADEAIAHAERIEHVGSLMHGLDIAVMVHHYRRDGPAVGRVAERLAHLGAVHDLEEYRAKGEIFLGWRDVDAGAVEAGLRRIEKGFGILQEVCTPEDFPVYQCMRADAFCRLGAPQKALDALGEGRAVIVAQGVAFWAAEIARQEAAAELARDNPDLGAVAASLREAREIAISQNALALELRTALTALAFARREGRVEAASADVERVLTRFAPGTTGRDLDEARAALNALARA
ncbi:MAG: adenylate/guanylate cyclase domain-containing protein [Acuticoccus sp.]